MSHDNIAAIRTLVNAHVDEQIDNLWQINQSIHANPELAYKEFNAHAVITSLLEQQGYPVKRSTYGLETSFEVSIGSGEKEVVFCAEYDALPGIGHACGHNLIATSSLGAFLGAAHAISALKLPGKLRLLGTPAEEDGGGKVDLIKAGAFSPPEQIAAAIMVHPMPAHNIAPPEFGVSGLAGLKFIALNDFQAEFRGKAAHAGGSPWDGVNALDAGVSAYNGVAMMRQQIRPEDRVHGIFRNAGTAPNVITDFASLHWNTRSPSSKRADELMERVKNCCRAGALASGCDVSFVEAAPYQNLRVNPILCETYVEEMAELNEKILLEQTSTFNASTDMGNVSYMVPSFHGAISIPTEPGVALHSRPFTEAARTKEAHAAAIASAKGMAMLAIRTLLDDALSRKAREEFERIDDV